MRQGYTRSDMSKTVLILGAGASASAGAPLMWNFLDEAERLRDSNAVADSSAEFNLVFKALAALNQTHSKATLDVINIESVFAAFEMAKLLGRLGTLTQDEIDKLPNAMRRVIVRTLEQTINIPVSGGGGGRTPGDYIELTNMVRKLGKTQTDLSKDLSIITFNYDLCADLALYNAGVPIKYGLSAAHGPREISLLKLHGSLNWGRCSGCKKLVAWDLSKYLASHPWLPYDVTTGRLAMSAHFHHFQHCSQSRFEDAPYVVPPTWNKSQYHAELETVWKSAAAELASAANIVVCGYSLPESDQFFRYLYALGTVGDLRLKNIWVFDPDVAVKERFNKLLGQAASPRFKFYQLTFDQVFPNLAPLMR
jgi:hypothetical protein